MLRVHNRIRTPDAAVNINSIYALTLVAYLITAIVHYLSIAKHQRLHRGNLGMDK